VGHDFSVIIFGPGLPHTGTLGQMLLGDARIELKIPDDSRQPASPVEALRLRDVGFGLRGVELGWTAPEGTWLVHILDPMTASVVMADPLIATLPATTALHALHSARRRRRVFALGGLGILLLAPLLLGLLLFVNMHRIAAWAVKSVPLEQEERFGRYAYDDLRRGLSIHDSGDELAAVRTIGQRLSAGSQYHYEYHLAEDASLNAYALPGGIVVVHAGLLRATRRPEELAAVLAHEIEHVEQRHGLAQLVQQLGWRAIWTLVSGNWDGTLTASTALQLGKLKFSREAERQADARGFERMVSAGIDPGAMPDVLGLLAQAAERRGGEPAAFLSSHPASSERAAQMTAQLRELGPRRFEPLPHTPWPPAQR
jgi:Zn-dependent protease with chaperone function